LGKQGHRSWITLEGDLARIPSPGTLPMGMSHSGLTDGPWNSLRWVLERRERGLPVGERRRHIKNIHIKRDVGSAGLGTGSVVGPLESGKCRHIPRISWGPVEGQGHLHIWGPRREWKRNYNEVKVLAAHELGSSSATVISCHQLIMRTISNAWLEWPIAVCWSGLHS
jgi:hypothetical protein